MTTDLFTEDLNSQIKIADGAYWLRGFGLPIAQELWQLISTHLAQHPPQHMMTPMGYPMSVQTTSFGPLGWVGNQSGYGYAKYNPFTQQAWPPIPALLSTMARDAASAAGYHHFEPDSCLINVYAIGTKMGLHQDKDERDFHQPIVSVSLGIPATFLFGGAKRSDPTMKIPVLHGDVIVWGGASRRFYHGISTIRPNQHPQLGNIRCNLTFRKAG